MGIFQCCNPDIKLYIGHKLFKPIETKIQIEEKLTEEEQNLIRELENLLIKSEEERKDIANKFKTMLINTGTCVLKRPTTERSLITYILLILVKLLTHIKKKNISFSYEDFNILNFISFSIQSPFIDLNNNELNKLIEKYGFDFKNDINLINGKNSICDFISSLSKCKTLFDYQIKQMKIIIDKINIKNIKQIKHINKAIDAFGIINRIIYEIFSAIKDFNKSLNKGKISLLYKIAEECCNKNIIEPKEIVFYYSEGQMCDTIENWENNICYKEIEESLKY